MKWELVTEREPNALENSTYRMQIPEGWLYRYGGQMVFVPTVIAYAAYARGVGMSQPVNPSVSNTFGT